MPPAPMASPLRFQAPDHLANTEGGFYISEQNFRRAFYTPNLTTYLLENSPDRRFSKADLASTVEKASI